MTSLYFWTIIIYLGVLVAFGLYLSRRVHSQEDFAIAGRSLPAFVIFGTLVATWTGTGSLFGHSEKTYTSGTVVLLIVIADIIGIGILYFLAGKVRKMEQVTIQDLLELRYNAAARVFGAIALILAYVTIVSYQYRAAGTILHLTMPGLSLDNATILAACFIVGFTVTAGLLSVAYTDVVQGVTMIIGLAFCIPVLLSKAGGLNAAIAALPPGYLNPLHNMSAAAVLGLTLPGFLLILGDANMYQRFFAARNEGAAKTGVWMMILGVTFVDLCILTIALLGRVIAPDLEEPGRVIAYLAVNHLPTILGVVTITTMGAIVVSTADSYLLAPSTAFVRDIYMRFINQNASQKEVVIVSRLTVVVLGLIAFGISKLSDQFLSVALYAYTIYGAAITPSLIAALTWRRVTTAGALSSIIGGTVVTLGWELMDLGTKLDAVIPAISVSTILLVFVSLATKPSPAEKLKPFGFDREA